MGKYCLIGICFVLFICLLVTRGCGGPENPLGRLAVSGEVTLNGEPLDRGTIEFVPQAYKSPVTTGALIIDGRFNIPTLKGLPAGIYTVRIYATEEVSTCKTTKYPEEQGPIPKERIPKEYNDESNLVFTVKSDDSNYMEFDIP